MRYIPFRPDDPVVHELSLARLALERLRTHGLEGVALQLHSSIQLILLDYPFSNPIIVLG